MLFSGSGDVNKYLVLHKSNKIDDPLLCCMHLDTIAA